MALEGDLQTIPLRDLLDWLARRRASGRLTLSRGMTVRRFHLRDGRVTLVNSSEEWTRLGRLLVDRGLVEDGEVERALGQRSKRNARLGRLLIDAGVISGPQLGSILGEKSRALLLDALAWDAGNFHFDEQAPARRQEGRTPPIDLLEVLETRTRPEGDRERVQVSDEDVIEIRPLPSSHQAA
jgi:Domain of unknown function (DUF4388)